LLNIHIYADNIVMYRPVNSQSDVSSLQNDVNSGLLNMAYY